MSQDDDYVIESADDFEVITRRKGPRESPAPPAAPPGLQSAPRMPSSSSMPREQDAEDPVWLLDTLTLPDPPQEPMRMEATPAPGPPPALFASLDDDLQRDVGPARSETDETKEQSRQYGGESYGEHDPADFDARRGEPLLPPTRSTRSERATTNDRPRGTTMQLAIAATEFNYDITSMMLERAHEHARFLGADITHVVRVPGVYDLPFAVQRLIQRDDVDGVVTIGCVIEGETDHDDLVIQHAARKIIDLSLQHDKPVGLGITGPGMSRLQAMARVDRAKEAVEAAVRLHRDLEGL